MRDGPNVIETRGCCGGAPMIGTPLYGSILAAASLYPLRCNFMISESCAAAARGRLPLNEHRTSDHKREEDRQKHRRHQPLAQSEFGDA